eukprot:7373813-Pyramimonas_sp.AAC.1
METGITWIVIRAEGVVAVPDLPTFLSGPHSIGHGPHRLQSKVQTLMQTHAKISRATQRSNGT